MTLKYSTNNEELNYYTSLVLERIESEAKDDLIEAAHLRTAIESVIQRLGQEQVIKDKILNEIEAVRNENKQLASNQHQSEELLIENDTIMMQNKIERETQQLTDKQNELFELQSKLKSLEETMTRDEEEAIQNFEKVVSECDKYCGLLKIAVDKQGHDKLILSFEDGYSLDRSVTFTTHGKTKILASGTPTPVEINISDPSSVSSFLLRLRNSFRLR